MVSQVSAFCKCHLTPLAPSDTYAGELARYVTVASAPSWGDPPAGLSLEK